jgi:hypothetical protein
MARQWHDDLARHAGRWLFELPVTRRSGLAVRLIRSERGGCCRVSLGRGRLAPLLSGLLSPPGRTGIRTHGMNPRLAGTGGMIHPARDRMTRRPPNHLVSEDLLPRSRELTAGACPTWVHPFQAGRGFGCPDSLSRRGSARSRTTRPSMAVYDDERIVLDRHRRQILDLSLGEVEPDSGLDPGDRPDRDGHFLVSPQVPLL